jgi:hypothetical protein
MDDAFYNSGGAAGDKSMGMIAGADEYLGSMTYTSQGDSTLNSLMAPVATTGIGANIGAGTGFC